MSDHIVIDGNGNAHLVPQTPAPTASNLDFPNRTESSSGVTAQGVLDKISGDISGANFTVDVAKTGASYVDPSLKLGAEAVSSVLRPFEFGANFYDFYIKGQHGAVVAFLGASAELLVGAASDTFGEALTPLGAFAVNLASTTAIHKAFAAPPGNYGDTPLIYSNTFHSRANRISPFASRH